MHSETTKSDFRDIQKSPEFPVRYHHLSNWYNDAMKWVGYENAREIKLQTSIPDERLPWNLPVSEESDHQFLEFATERSIYHAEYYINEWKNTEEVIQRLEKIIESVRILQEKEPEIYRKVLDSLKNLLVSSGAIHKRGRVSFGAISIEHRKELLDLLGDGASVEMIEDFILKSKPDYAHFVSDENLNNADQQELAELKELAKEIELYESSGHGLVDSIQKSSQTEHVITLINELVFFQDHKNLEVNLQYQEDLLSALEHAEQSLDIYTNIEKQGKERLHYIADLYGENPSLTAEATKQTIQRNIDNRLKFLKLAQENPDTKIQVSGEPDLICSACHGGTEFGEHCTRKLEEGEGSADETTKNVLAKLYANPPAYLNLREDISISFKESGNIEFEMPVRLLFDQKFVYAVEHTERVRKI